LADGGAKPPGYVDEQLIAGCVPEAVVDHLELVKIDEQDSETDRLLISRLDSGLEAVDEVKAVWKAGQRIRGLAFGEPRKPRCFRSSSRRRIYTMVA